MKKIRVLNMIKGLGRGGAEKLLAETGPLHDKSLFEFYYAYFLDRKDQMVPDLESQDVEVHCFNANTNPAMLFKYKEVADFIRSRNIDIVHCHLPWAGFIGRLLHKFSGIPVVYTEHNNVNRYNPLTKILNNFTFNWQSYAVAVSNDSYNSVLENLKPSIPFQPLLNAVNTETFKRDIYNSEQLKTENNIPPGKKVVVTVAVFRAQKRLDRWAEVVREVTARSNNYFFVLVGEGNERPVIEGLLEKYNLKDKVLLTGLLTDPKPFYAIADFFLMTSDFEGLPVSLLEAMSMECIPVCTAVGGIPEVLTDGVDGKLAELNNNVVKTLSENIMSVTEMQISDLKQSARKTVVERFSMKRMVAELEKIYDQIYAERVNRQASPA